MPVRAVPAGRHAEALVASLPADSDGVVDWNDAGPYLRANLAALSRAGAGCSAVRL